MCQEDQKLPCVVMQRMRGRCWLIELGMIRLRCMPTQPEVRHLHNLLQSHWLLCALLCERVQTSTASNTKGIDLNDGYTIENEAKGNRQKANPRVLTTVP